MLRSALLADVPHGFTGRAEGDFTPAANGRVASGADARILVALGRVDSLHMVVQVHGDRVVDVEAGRVEADGIVSAEAGRAVAVRVADCVPVLIVGPGVVAAVHAGWRGTAADIVRKGAHEVASRAGCRASDLRAAIGPCIRGCCYEVGEEVILGVASVAPGRSWLDGRHVDLAIANAAILAELGVACEIVGPCTHCSAEHWSWRRDGPSGGRQIGVVALPGPDVPRGFPCDVPE